MNKKLLFISLLVFKIYCVLCAILVTGATILYIRADIPTDVRLIEEVNSPNNEWIAITKFEDGRGYLMFTPPYYTVYLRSSSKLWGYFSEEEVFQVEYTDKRPPIIKWKDSNNLIIKKGDESAQTNQQINTYKNINISYK